MKYIYFFLFLGITYRISAQVNNYQVGDIVNDFTVTDTQGNQYSLYSLTAQGKYVYLDFFYVDCASCQSKISIFNEFWDKYGCGDYDIFCLAVNRGYDNNAEVDNFENLYGGNTFHAPAVSADGGAAAVTADFGVNVFSTFCLIAPDNKLLVSEINPVNGVKNLEDALPPDFTPTPMPCTNSETEIFFNNLNVYYSNGNLHLDFTNSIPFALSLYDLTGKELLTGKYFAKQLQLDLKAFKKGIYVLQIYYNNRLETKKITVR